MKATVTLSSTIILLFLFIVIIRCAEESHPDPIPEYPTVNTTNTSSITATTFFCGGNVSNDGGTPIIARGVCWSKSPNPTIADNKTVDGLGKGIFTSSIVGLSPNTQYYVKAYATNSIGTAYGGQLFIITSKGLPEIATTFSLTFITSTSAIGGGIINTDGGYSILERGVCWSTVPNPTVNDNKTIDGSGAGVFTSNFDGLTNGLTYYFRVYATNSNGTSYGNQVVIKLSNDIYLPFTGHYYKYISRPLISWTSAKNEAESDSMKFNGLRGYLATITSIEENTFIQQKLRGNAWIGASDAEIEGDWRWVTGPEGLEEDGKGRLFWRGTGYQAKSNPFNFGPVQGAYHNWNRWYIPYGSTTDKSLWEPNSLSDENYAHFTFLPSIPSYSMQWNDLRNSGGPAGLYATDGYIIEYGGLTNKP